MVAFVGFVALAVALLVIGAVAAVFLIQDEIKANRRFNRRVSRRR